jgi:hypothetical protein
MKEQASALFLQFFHDSRKPSHNLPNIDTDTDTEKPSPLPPPSLPPSEINFSSHQYLLQHIPQNTFSTAELQGYLLSYKHDPEAAVDNIEAWVERELRESREKE